MLSRSSRKVKTTGLNHFCTIPTKCLVTIPNLLSAWCFLRAVSEIKVQPDTVGMTLTPVNICKRRSLRSHSTQLLNPKCHSNIKFSSPTVTYHAHSVATIRHKQLAKQLPQTIVSQIAARPDFVRYARQTLRLQINVSTACPPSFKSFVSPNGNVLKRQIQRMPSGCHK